MFNGLQFLIGGFAGGGAAPFDDVALVAGETYVLNQSDPSNHGYELSFSLSPDGVWGGAAEYDPNEHGGELTYFVDAVKVNRST